MNNQYSHQDAVRNYYWNSRFGYAWMLWDSQHFGYHPDGKKISEKQAQLLMQDQLAQTLALPAGSKVLDAGCGRGVVATHLARQYGLDITGIDIVDLALDKARKRQVREAVSDRTRFLKMDYTDLAFEDESFDAVYTMETLSHAPDLNQALHELHRVLKPGGKAVFFEYTLAEESLFSSEEMEILEDVIEGSAMFALPHFRHNKFDTILASAGFRQIQTTDISNAVGPSLARLRQFARVPYAVVNRLGWRQRFPNLMAAVEFYQMGQKDLIRYNIFSAVK